ncbi:MFS transporter prlL [Apiospora marii]|uniref:MFS transporter prlL n=1 Tax=Apiospora marii TaxID=335849 RepID=UPI003130B68C
MSDSKDMAITAIDRPDGPLQSVDKDNTRSDQGSESTSTGFITSEDERSRARQLLTPEEEKKLLRRIDWHLMPLCSIIFMFKNLDSDNIPYIIGEAPSNLLIKRFSPSKWQSRILVSWGIVLGLHCLAKDSAGLYAARFFLGLFEAGQFPGVILQMCYWYRPDEMSLRLLYFYICGNLSGIFSGILAFAFDHLSGYGGLSGWQWLFLVESLATVVMGVIVWYTLPDCEHTNPFDSHGFPRRLTSRIVPDTASWLSEKEKAFIQARLPPNAPRASEQTFKFSEIVASLKDIRLWLFTLIWAFFTVGTSGVRFYQPTVIANLGFTDIATAQILNIPITVLGLAIIATTGTFADNARLPRPLYPLAFLTAILACYGVLVAYPSNGAVYAATMVGNAVTAAWYPMMWPWRVQTTSRATGSAFAIGFVNSYGQIGGAVGPQLFRAAYAPRYRVSFGVAMALVGACMGMTLLTWFLTRETESETRRLKRAKLAAAGLGEGFVGELGDGRSKAGRREAV